MRNVRTYTDVAKRASHSVALRATGATWGIFQPSLGFVPHAEETMKVLRICQHGHGAEIYGCFDGKRELKCAGCCYDGHCQDIAEFKSSLKLNGCPGICDKCLAIIHSGYADSRGSSNRLLPVKDK